MQIQGNISREPPHDPVFPLGTGRFDITLRTRYLLLNGSGYRQGGGSSFINAIQGHIWQVVIITVAFNLPGRQATWVHLCWVGNKKIHNGLKFTKWNWYRSGRTHKVYNLLLILLPGYSYHTENSRVISLAISSYPLPFHRQTMTEADW